MTVPLTILSLGAGVQSSCLALMFAEGELTPMPDAAIFADTGDEPAKVYEYLDFLEGELPFPIYRVTAGKLSDAAVTVKTTKDGQRTYLSPGLPVHIQNQAGGKGMGMRQCTRSFKIDPINKFLRDYAEIPRGCKEIRIICYVGISYDELIRMKPARKPWIENQWPLVDRGIRRLDCLTWMSRHGYPKPVRSACTYCPYHNDREWLDIKSNQIEFAKAVKFEKRLQQAYRDASALDGTPYLHASLQPLNTVDLDPSKDQIDMFGNECEGMCGV